MTALTLNPLATRALVIAMTALRDIAQGCDHDGRWLDRDETECEETDEGAKWEPFTEEEQANWLVSVCGTCEHAAKNLRKALLLADLPPELSEILAELDPQIEKSVFEVHGAGLSSTDDVTDKRVVWVLAADRSEVERAIEGTGATMGTDLRCKTDVHDFTLPEGLDGLRTRLLGFAISPQRPKKGEKVALVVPTLAKQAVWLNHLAPGTAMTAFLAGDGPDRELAIVYYEGNINGASNIMSFEDRAIHAVGRMIERYPTVALTAAPLSELVIVGSVTYDGIEVQECPALSAWLSHAPGLPLMSEDLRMRKLYARR